MMIALKQQINKYRRLVKYRYELNLFTKLNESNACPNYIYLVLPVQPNPYGPKPARILQHKNQGDSNI